MNNQEDNSSGEFVNVINTRMLKRKAISSYAIILHTVIDGKIFYLIGRVRDTIPFREFIRGNIKDSDMCRYMIHMAKEEKYRILSEPFQELVDDIMVNHSTRVYRSTCEGEAEFELSRRRYESLLRDPNIGLKEAGWQFPKGRKMEPETDAACALREFEEETRIPQSMVSLYDEMEPLEEIYTGLDGKTYRTVYFVGYMDYINFQTINQDMRRQFIITQRRVSLSEEIAKIKFVQYEEALEKLDPTKSYILRLANTFLMFHLERLVKRRNSL